MNATRDEIASQPDVWQEALACSPDTRDLLRSPGESMLVIGCGTSAFVADSLARLREAAGFGVTDAAYASEVEGWRSYDHVVAISRSGTTSEVASALRTVPEGVRTTLITGVVASAIEPLVDDAIVLDFADEESVVQTRFPTTVLILARAAFDADVRSVIAEAREEIGRPLPIDVARFEHFVFLGTGWSYGLAQEAALKVRETSQAWAESYPLLDYRHGPLAVAGGKSLVSIIGPTDRSLEAQIAGTGARVLSSDSDPLVGLLRAQRMAVALAESRGLNPDAPKHLTRSIILP